MTRSPEQPLLLGEWACLGILHSAPAHGFAIAARLKPEGDIGRVWSLSRALTYRSLAQLAQRGHIRPVGEEPGLAGGTRTLLAATPAGRRQLLRWLRSPVPHLRDLRSELLLKLILSDQCGVDPRPMLAAQRTRIEQIATAMHATTSSADVAGESLDVVALWRLESAEAALRFLDRLPA